jgi:hypothetical protein
MKDRIHLQQLWSFLQHQIHVIATYIKTSAQKVFDLEALAQKDTQILFHLTSNKSQNVPTRGLTDLTNDMIIFAKLHMWFTWILRACVYRLKEEFLCSAPVEDTQIKIEKTKYLNDIEIKNNIIPLIDQMDSLDLGQYKIKSYHELSEAREIIFTK